MTTRLATILRNAIGVVAVLLTVITGRAATPSFDSFDTNDFRVVKTTAPWKILSNTANTTNNFTNVVVNYINSTIINTNTIITNVNTTIVNTNTTIVNQGDTIINTNVTEVSNYTTNFIDNSVITITNTVINITNTVININGNTNGVGSLNPTIGRLPYKQDTNSFGDSSMYFIDTNTTGTATLEVTDLANGGVVVSLPSGIVTNIINGTGALTNDGAGNLGWADISGANLWHVVGGTNLEPVNLSLQPMITNGLAVGPNTLSFWGKLDEGSAIVSYGNKALGDPAFKGFYFGVGSDGTHVQQLQLQMDASDTELTLNKLDGTTNLQVRLAANNGNNYIEGTLNSTNMFSVDENGNIYTMGSVTFGPGTTNVLSRSGNDLVYTNNSTDTKFLVVNTSGNFLSLEAQSLTGFLSAAGSANAVGLRQGANQVLLSGGVFSPIPDSSQSLGSQNERWLDYNISGTGYTYGYLTNLTNYSRLAVSHTGTNGVGAGIVFESKANGLAGSPRPFVFTNAPVQLPWFTSLQKTNLAEVANGMLIYQTDNTPGIRAYVNGAWVILNTSADP